MPFLNMKGLMKMRRICSVGCVQHGLFSKGIHTDAFPKLLQPNPRRRYGIDEILEHRYFLRNEYVAPLSHSQRFTLTTDSFLVAPPNFDISRKVRLSDDASDFNLLIIILFFSTQSSTSRTDFWS